VKIRTLSTSSDQLRRRPTRQTGVTAADAESTEAAIPRVALRCYIRRLTLKRRIEIIATGGPMTAITLDQADRLIDAILKRGADLDCRPLSVIVVEPGCKVKAFKKEDGSSMIRFEMAYGKTYAALAMGRSSKLVKVRAEEKPIFMRYLLSATGDQIFPEGGGVQIRDADGEVIGAVGVTGDTEDRDEELAVYGVRAIGLKTDEDCTDLGRRGGVRLTNT